MLDILLDVLLDTLKMLPVLYLVYLLVDYFSHHSNKRDVFMKANKYGPLVASVFGIIPQCGFSASMADLYNKRAITLGTLIAVFISTSDEALIVLLEKPDQILYVLIIIGLKFVFGICFGFLIDLIFKKNNKEIKVVAPETIPMQAIDTCEDIHEKEEHCNHIHDHKDHAIDDCCADNIFYSALKHSLKIALILFVTLFVMEALFEWIGEENVKNFLNFSPILEVFVCSILGLVPSCAVSVVLIEAFCEGLIGFAGLFAGLCSCAGVGIIVLFTTNKKNIKHNFLVLGILYGLAVIAGLIVFAVMSLFGI